MKKIAYDLFKCDAGKILEDSKNFLKVSAVISKAGVYKYEDGYALKPKRELLAATPTARYAKIVLHNHPPSKMVMSKSQVYGAVENPYFDRDKIRSVLSFDKRKVPTKDIDHIRMAVQQGSGLDNSIGFYYEHDPTSGVDMDVNTGMPKPYNYIMRDIWIDHVAVMLGGGDVRGRCTFPNCGIGVDAIMRRIALDPFGGYESFEDCVAKNKDKEDPEAYCATIKRKVEEATLNWGQSQSGGKTKEMSLEELFYPERSKEFNECVKQRMAEGMQRGEAEAHCAAATKPEDEPQPEGPAGVSDYSAAGDIVELSPWQACIKEHMQSGMSKEEAAIECKQSGLVKSDSDAAFENCVARKKEGGMSEEEAVKQCRTEHPVDEGDQEPEKSPLERCVEEQMEQGKTAEEAKSWCESELSGEHEAVDSMIDRGKKLMRLRHQRTIERRKHARRHPLR